MNQTAVSIKCRLEGWKEAKSHSRACGYRTLNGAAGAHYVKGVRS